MKQIIGLMLVTSLMLGLLAGCGGQTTPSSPADDAIVIDVFAGVNLYEGIYTGTRDAMLNGSGHYWVNDLRKDLDAIEYDRSNSDIKEFLKRIDFYWMEKEELGNRLKNGDTVTVGLEYSKSEAEALGIVLKEETKSLTVDWLFEVYRDHTQISDEAIRQAYDAADPVNSLLKDCDPDWYLTGEGSEGPDRYENYTYHTTERTFFQYDVDGNGESYVKYLLVMVGFHSEYDWYCDDEFDFHGTEEQYRLYSIRLDQSNAPYAYYAYGDDDSYFREIESIGGESWDGTLRFANYSMENDTLVAYKDVVENGNEITVLDKDAPIVEFTLN